MTRRDFFGNSRGHVSRRRADRLPGSGDNDALAEFASRKPDLAVQRAPAALASCRARGCRAGIVGIDRPGVPESEIRDRCAGPHAPARSRGMAWTAVSLRARTPERDARIAPGELPQGLRPIAGAPVPGGGAPVESAGISAFPGPSIGRECAVAGLEAIAGRLDI